MKHWMAATIAAKPASNELLPGSRSRGEVDILIVDGYRKVVLAIANRPRRRGTFFSTTS
jgi:hypothetical protein